jgi:hypothetical protein
LIDPSSFIASELSAAVARAANLLARAGCPSVRIWENGYLAAEQMPEQTPGQFPDAGKLSRQLFRRRDDRWVKFWTPSF